MTNNMALKREGPVSRAALDAWLEHELSADDARNLRTWVGESTPWRDAYRDLLAEVGAEAVVPRLDATRSISVAACAAEVDLAQLVDLLPVPHLGSDAYREGRLTTAGTLWRVVGASDDVGDVADVELPYGRDRIVWVDPVLGPLETALRELPADALGAAHDSLVSVARLADGLEHPRAREVALAVAHDLEDGSLRDGLRSAQQAFENAKLDDDQEQAWVVSALETQIALDRLAHRLCDPELDTQLLAADKSLAPLGEALMLLDEEHYAELVHEHAVDMDAWWGFRARLDARVSEARLQVLLEPEEDTQSQEYDNVVSLGAARELRAADGVPTMYRAAAASNEPGTVFVLVRLEAPGAVEHGRGRVLRVSVRLGNSGDPFADCRWFGALAREAVRDAYEAVASQCLEGAGPHPLEDHKIVLDDPGPIESVDGSSLGLALALGFASLWTNTRVEPELAATGRLYCAQPDKVWRVGPVDGVPAKSEAWATFAGEGTQPSLLAHPDHAQEVGAARVQPLRADTVAQALNAAGVAVHAVPSAWPDRASKVRALEELLAHVESQDVQRFAGFGNPWSVVARRVVRLAESLPGPRHAELVARAHPQAALAYVHAGEHGAAREVLEHVGLDEAPLRVRLAASIAHLNIAIDEAGSAGFAEGIAAIDAMLGQFPGEQHPDLVGQALGTQGRARLHARDFPAAKSRLSAAVEHHAANRPDEVGRSRVYLAAALRHLGQLDEAMAVLERALLDLQTYTRPESVAYFRSCRMFLLYERARVSIACSNPGAAFADAEEALHLSRHSGFWPRLGILRVMAWSHQMLGNPELAEACVDEMRRLKVGDHADLRDRLVAEAEQPPVLGGEVY